MVSRVCQLHNNYDNNFDQGIGKLVTAIPQIRTLCKYIHKQTLRRGFVRGMYASCSLQHFTRAPRALLFFTDHSFLPIFIFGCSPLLFAIFLCSPLPDYDFHAPCSHPYFRPHSLLLWVPMGILPAP